MSHINKDFYEDVENQKKATQINAEIAACLSQANSLNGLDFPLVPYLLHKASLVKDPFSISYQNIIDGNIDISEDVCCLAEKVLTCEKWKYLQPMLAKYSAEEFALAAVMPRIESESKETESTPSSIIKLVNRILDVKAGERVADICCGTGNYMISAAIKESQASYRGFEINKDRSTAASMRADLLDADIKTTICDVFSLMKGSEVQKFDKIFAGYPFGLKLRNLESALPYLKRFSEENLALSKLTSSDWIFNLLLCDLLDENGKAAAVIANGSTWNKFDQRVRRYFINRNLIECIIYLPGRMFPSTNIPTALIVFSHGNTSVRMVDATGLCHHGRHQNEFADDDIEKIMDALSNDCEYSRNITTPELVEQDYNLNPGTYIKDAIELSDSVALEEIIKNISRGAPCTATQLDEMMSDHITNTQYLMLSSIQDGLIDRDLPYLSELDHRYEKYYLKNNTLILSKNGFPYKVAVATVEDDQHILVNGNLYMIELDESRVDPYYIQAFLDSKQGHLILESMSAGASIPSISVAQLKRIEIPLPSLADQAKIAKKYRAALNKISDMKRRLKKEVTQLHTIFDNETIR